jgi:phosphoribosylformylglycinamidine synthase subunit PurQ / glutaminase
MVERAAEPPVSTPAYDSRRPRSPWVEPSGPIPGADAVAVLVLAGYGLNCEAESAAGFRMLGARAEILHVADLLGRGESALAGTHVVVFGGGFSFGDHIASGRVLANRMRYRLGNALARHVDDGGLVLGICNGFQTLVKLGLVPGLHREPGTLAQQQVTLATNERPGYYDGWVKLAIDPDSPCVFTRGATGAILEIPSRHGEGRLLMPAAVAREVADRSLVPVRYVDATGEPTQAWPHNPSGSVDAIAGLCDPTGRVFGLMPHPEAYLYPENHPDWLWQRDVGALPSHGFGLGLLANGVRAVVSGTV